MQRFWLVPGLLIALVLYGLMIPTVWNNREQARSEMPAAYIIPSKFSRILALGHTGVLSDYYFLKTTTFLGGRIATGQPISKDDWQYVVRGLDVVTDLDPYFSDPYVLAEGLLAWGAGMPGEANRLLEKGIAHRTRDWRLKYYVGFNYFYFFQDYALGSDYIMAAAQMSGSPTYLVTLGARLGYYGGKSKTALLFLEEMIADAVEPMMRKRLQMRHLALKRAVSIEDALALYVEKEGHVPELGALVDAGYLEHLPPDPYGGEWVLLPNGRVFSTSRFVDKFK